jgi:hypothetical protein
VGVQPVLRHFSLRDDGVGPRRTAVGVPTSAERAAELAALLAGRFSQYRDAPFSKVLVLQVVRVLGWASGDAAGPGHA